jgi:hypothetical protein
MLPVKKIYIDSRHRTPDSVDASNFKYELPYSLQLPDNTVFFVTDICIPHVFRLIEQDVNDRLYYNYYCNMTGQGSNIYAFYNFVTLPSGGYTGTNLATTIQSLMNGAVEPGANITFTVTWDPTAYSINVVSAGTNAGFKFLTDAEVVRYKNQFASSLDPSNTKSANDILKISTPTMYYDSGITFVSDFISLQPIHNVYITSPNLGSFDTIAPFSNNVIKKVPVTVPYGYMIIDQNSTTNDFLNCSNQTIRTLEFHLKDSRGRYINLHGMNVSFSIVFNRYNSSL